jgi:hypothetical protein
MSENRIRMDIAELITRKSLVVSLFVTFANRRENTSIIVTNRINTRESGNTQ